MLFTSNIFLFLFLPFTLAIYYLLHERYRNTFLMLMSFFFYGYGEPRFLIMMLLSITFNYVLAILIDRYSVHNKIKDLLLYVTIMGNVIFLFVFKYLAFSATILNGFGFSLPIPEIVLPIGISFFTFQAMSYVVDVYRGTVPVQKSYINVALYVSFFPQLIAGPIVRYSTINEQIQKRYENFNDFSKGVHRFIIGFGKKVLLANNMALIADKAFSLSGVKLSTSFAWLGIIAYAFQILFDFSGYSDMAIGLGQMFGFNFLENFNYPYISKSVSEFWRRWHMSLGQWFRDYVYFPLGGSRVKTNYRLIFNLFAVWILTGIWHGASWNFVFWGILYFILITFEKLTGYPNKFVSPVSKFLYRIFTLLCILSGWVLFRAHNLSSALEYISSMINLNGNSLWCANTMFYLNQHGVLLMASIVCSTPIIKVISGKISSYYWGEKLISYISFPFYLFILIWSVSFIILDAHNPFIYFNF